MPLLLTNNDTIISSYTGANVSSCEGPSSERGKRKRPDSREEVVEWFMNLQNELPGCDEKDWSRIIDLVKRNSITGQNLLELTQQDLAALGIERIGWQKTILKNICELATGKSLKMFLIAAACDVRIQAVSQKVVVSLKAN